METWEIWFPDASANGLLVTRARIEPTTWVWLHASPHLVSVVVRDAADRPVARGERLERSGQYFPMTRLERTSETIFREDRFPTDSESGSVVLLPGGEAGTLVSWWNAADASEWRWRLEFYNRR